MKKINLVKSHNFIAQSSARVACWIEGLKWLHLTVKGYSTQPVYAEAKAVVYKSRW